MAGTTPQTTCKKRTTAGFAALALLLGTGAPLAQTAPLSPAAPALPAMGEVIPAAAQPLRPVGPRQGVIFGGDRAQRPTPPGYPEPSVIVGEPPAPAELPEPAPEAPVAEALAGEGFGTGAEDRLRLRAQDPALFASLMDSGAFDPAPDQVIVAIQAELARLACYRGTADGDWGAGSRAALARWVAAGGGEGGDSPDVALFRRIAGGPDLRCPAPVAATPARQAPAAAARQPAARQPQAQPATPRRTTPTAPQAPRAAQPAPRQPAAPQPPARRIDPNALGTGVFR